MILRPAPLFQEPFDLNNVDRPSKPPGSLEFFLIFPLFSTERLKFEFLHNPVALNSIIGRNDIIISFFYHNRSKYADCLGDCPRIAILFKIKEYLKNSHRHIVDIPRIIFFSMMKSLGKRASSDGLLVDHHL
jgi:hypothetical protein